MTERLTSEGRVTWDNPKDVQPKTKGRQKGGTNGTSSKSTKSRRFSAAPPVNPLERVLVLNTSGKVTWQWREREATKK